MWDLPRPGLEPVSPALAGGFLTTAPPGKPCFYFFDTVNNAVVNICVQVFVRTFVFISLGHVPRSGIVGSFGNSV